MLENQSYNYGQRPGLRKKIVLLLIGLALIAAVYWASTVSFIVVETGGTVKAEYKISRQSTSGAKTVMAGSSLRRMVSRGNYEVTVRSNEESFFSVVKTGRFFSTVKVDAKLQKERARNFVGNNPLSCYHYSNSRLYSYDCGRTYASTIEHVPASGARPTFTQRIPGNNEAGLVEGMFSTKEGSFALVRITVGEEGEESKSQVNGHILYRVGDGLRVSQRTALTDLDPNASYSVRATGSGFMAYKSDFSQIFYFSGSNTKPTKVTIPKPKSKNVALLDADIRESQSVFLYGTNANRDSKERSSEVVLVSGNQTSSTRKNTGYQRVVFCGQSSICANDGKMLDIFKLSGSKLKQSTGVADVISLTQTSGGLLVIRDREILRYDPDSGNGFLEYSISEDHSYAGIEPTSGGYLLILDKKSENRRIALLISQANADVDEIDKKVLTLEKIKSIYTVSAYGKFIYISPNYGTLQPGPDGEYAYDANKKRQVDEEIQKAVSQLNLPSLGYTVINNLK